MTNSAWKYVIIACGLLGALSLGVYLLSSYKAYSIGFPLDDAWIHQTYARNLADFREWSFIPGEPSAGSTSPLWSFLLTPGHLLGWGPFPWTFILGWLLLCTLALLAGQTIQLLFPANIWWILAAILLILFEWHLVWSAGSGMETLLIANLNLLVMNQLLRGRENWFAIGLLIGVSIWVRPDGILLAGPAIFVAVTRSELLFRRLRRVLLITVGIALLFVPYLFFNHQLAGSWWPNTFFAKQAEYAAILAIPLWIRYLNLLLLPLVGVGIILLPGFMLINARAIRERRWEILAGSLWFGGYLLVYALRLPVTYQHGRYIIPAMPVYFVWSLSGMGYFLRNVGAVTWKRIVGRVWLLTGVLVLVIFWYQGMRAYSTDVAIIQSEMVNMANWVNENTPKGSLIAAHDIGALGYFGNRRLVDLAGLISPEVIPFIRDENKLRLFLDQKHADYLVTFPGWYPDLVKELIPIYSTGSSYSPAAGGENIAIYALKSN